MFASVALAPESRSILEELYAIAKEAGVFFVGKVRRALKVSVPLNSESKSFFFAQGFCQGTTL